MIPRRIKYLILSFCLVLGTSPLFAGENLGNVLSQPQPPAPLVLTFSEALRMASRQNVNVIVANERVRQAMARIEQNSSGLWPQLRGDISEKRQTRDLTSLGITSSSQDAVVGPFNVFDARLKLTQTLFDAATLSRLQAARDQKQLSVAQSEKVRQDTLALTAALFLEAQRSKESVDLAKALVERDRLRFKVAQKRFKSGTGSALETKKVKADYSRSIYAKRKAQSDAQERRLDLAAALGIPNDQPILFVMDKDFLREDPASAELKNSAQDSPDMAVAREQLKSAQSLHTVERAEYLPKISAIADYGVSGLEPQEGSETYMLGVQASLPIFEGGLRSARVKEAASKVKENEAALVDVSRRSEAVVLNALQALKETKSLVRNQEDRFAVAQQELELVRRRVAMGTASEVDLADKKAQAAAAADQKNEAYAAIAVARVNLARALGNLDQWVEQK